MENFLSNHTIVSDAPALNKRPLALVRSVWENTPYPVHHNLNNELINNIAQTDWTIVLRLRGVLFLGISVFYFLLFQVSIIANKSNQVL